MFIGTQNVIEPTFLAITFAIVFSLCVLRVSNVAFMYVVNEFAIINVSVQKDRERERRESL